MQSILLLPNKYKIIGWFILIPTTIFSIILMFNDFNLFKLDAKVFAIFNNEILGESQYFKFIDVDITNTVVGILLIIGALLVGFSKEKIEDEFISNLRLSSLLWAVFINYILLLFSFLFIYGVGFINVMLYNMFTVLIIFIARFNYVLYVNYKNMSDEKHH
ncbi:MAG: hypothetical protein IT215_02000 [Chitinophagaceae bacterium]|nr:hypothetical protein [Chitinophagaceae bacterium]HMN33685.1 hypothetical protein [Chitinophagaceae bacterium]